MSSDTPHEYVYFDTGYKANYDFGVHGIMPPKHVFVPGDVVSWHDNDKIIGMIISRIQEPVTVEGLVFQDPHGKTIHNIDFYTVLWNTGTLRKAGAHASWQLIPTKISK